MQPPPLNGTYEFDFVKNSFRSWKKGKTQCLDEWELEWKKKYAQDKNKQWKFCSNIRFGYKFKWEKKTNTNEKYVNRKKNQKHWNGAKKTLCRIQTNECNSRWKRTTKRNVEINRDVGHLFFCLLPSYSICSTATKSECQRQWKNVLSKRFTRFLPDLPIKMSVLLTHTHLYQPCDRKEWRESCDGSKKAHRLVGTKSKIDEIAQ